jgi:hypothetical protein
MYCLFCVILCIVCVYMCYCHRVATQLQLNIYIISYMSYRISYIYIYISYNINKISKSENERQRKEGIWYLHVAHASPQCELLNSPPRIYETLYSCCHLTPHQHTAGKSFMHKFVSWRVIFNLKSWEHTWKLTFGRPVTFMKVIFFKDECKKTKWWKHESVYSFWFDDDNKCIPATRYVKFCIT